MFHLVCQVMVKRYCGWSPTASIWLACSTCFNCFIISAAHSLAEPILDIPMKQSPLPPIRLHYITLHHIQISAHPWRFAHMPTHHASISHLWCSTDDEALRQRCLFFFLLFFHPELLKKTAGSPSNGWSNKNIPGLIDVSFVPLRKSRVPAAAARWASKNH